MSKRWAGSFASVWILLVSWALLSATPAQSPASPQAAAAAGAATHGATITQYCVTCHNDRTRTGGLTLQGLDVLRPADAAETWERVIRKLRTRTMPPPGMPRPNDVTYASLTSFLEMSLDRVAVSHPNPGRPLIRRLNRTEYGNAIRDLLDLQVDASQYLPPDDSAFGFDNIAEVLGISPALLERYLVAADRISELAVGATVSEGSTTYRIRQDRSQDQHIEGLPLGTVGGLAVPHTFPADGEYRFSLNLYRNNLEAIRGLELPHQVEITVDGARVFLGTIGGEADAGGDESESVTDRSDAIDARLQVVAPIRAGTHVVGAAFIRKVAAGTQRLRPFLRSSAGTYDSTGRPHIEALTIGGPFHPGGPGETATRRRLFVCRPSRTWEEEPCARTIITTVARRAYRRPVTGTELRTLLDFYRAGREKGTFDAGIQLALRRVLASPSFVFRVEEEPAGAAGAVRPVSDFELATRLSFFLWSSIPDDELLAVAARNELRQPQVLEQQVRRMLADPRADALAGNFAGQWLHLRNLRTIVPNHDAFPDFDDTLREAFRREAELFFDSIVREDRSVTDLLTADHTFVNERLAKHYGIPNVYGSHFRRVTLPQDERRGLLGKGGLLLATSHADRTSPVVRGKWILENLLGTPPPPPPANVPLLDASKDEAKPRSLRARMEAHRASLACAGCHRVMDPLGFAMENFDAVGAWRVNEGGIPIDASGRLADGAAVDGVVALRQALVARPDVFVQTFTEKLLTYSLGRGLQYYDMPAVRAIVRDAKRGGYRFSSIVLGIVSSAPFQMRMKGDAGPVEARRRS